MRNFGELKNLFYEDYNNPGMPAIWNTETHTSSRKITWSIEDKQILFGGKYEPVDSRIYNYLRQISYALSLWDKALDSIKFERTYDGNNADITFGTSPNTYGNLALFVRKIPRQTGYIEAGRVKLNPGILSRYPRDLQMKVIIHEIGNLLGLGDIKCSPNIKSVQEDKCSPPEPFTGGNSLYDFDKELIKYVYGELRTNKSTRQFNGSSGRDRLIGTNGDDTIFGFGGADKIIGARGDDLIDPGIWTKGKYDSISGGRGADTFVLKDGYFAFIKDFRVIEDKLGAGNSFAAKLANKTSIILVNCKLFFDFLNKKEIFVCR